MSTSMYCNVRVDDTSKQEIYSEEGVVYVLLHASQEREVTIAMSPVTARYLAYALEHSTPMSLQHTVSYNELPCDLYDMEFDLVFEGGRGATLKSKGLAMCMPSGYSVNELAVALRKEADKVESAENEDESEEVE